MLKNLTWSIFQMFELDFPLPWVYAFLHCSPILYTRSCGQILTHVIRIEFTDIIPNDWFTQTVWFSNKRLICYCFSCENNWGTTGHFFRYFSNKSLSNEKMGKTYIRLTCVDRFLLDSAACSRDLTCLSLCQDKIQSISA